MHSKLFLSAIGLFSTMAMAMAMPAKATCYVMSGSACVTKHYGNLDSTCQYACSVGLTATKVQQALKDKGNDPGPIDGIAGIKTQSALKAFQQKQGVPQTGRMDKATLDKLGVELK